MLRVEIRTHLIAATNYCLIHLFGGRHPAALASASEQNQRSPFPIFILVFLYQGDDSV